MKYIFVFIVLFLGCKSPKIIQNKDFDQIIVEEDKPQIIFQTFSISKNERKNGISLVNQVVTFGTLKPRINRPISLDSGNLQYALLDKNKNVLDSILIFNPLNKNVEYVDDEGGFARKTIELDNAEFTVRISLHPETYFIEIVQFYSSGNKQLFLTKIK